MGFPVCASGREPACRCRRGKRLWFDPWVGKTPWRRTWQLIPVFLPGEFHGRRNLAGYSPWGHKESDTTEWPPPTTIDYITCILEVFTILEAHSWASQVVLVVKNPSANAEDTRDTGLIPGLGRSPGGGHDNPLQYFCLENPMDREAWQATVHRVTKKWTRIKQLSMTHALILLILFRFWFKHKNWYIKRDI